MRQYILHEDYYPEQKVQKTILLTHILMTLTTHILDAEEQEISDLMESGTLTTVSNFTELKRDLMLSAREHIRRKPVTIRLQGSLLREIRAEAAKK
jgi:hypothetical protein